MVGALLTAIAAAVMPAPQPARPVLPDADPALWVLRDADTTIYLFGTFHALDGRSEWFNDEVHTAFSLSNELILETVLPKLDSRPAPPPTGHSSIRGYSVTPSANFLGATRMAVSAGKEQGLDVRKGADMVLRRAAEDAGKKVEGLESVEFQLTMLSRMAAPAGKTGKPVVFNAGAMAQAARLMSQMQASWSRGDQRIFVELLDQMRQSSPDNYRVMFPERNAHWAEWVAHRMDQPGTVFVAVGAGHFAGPDSVLAKLGSKGLMAKRVN